MTTPQARYQRKVRKARREAGLCMCCGQPPEPGRMSCAKSLEENRARARRTYQRKKQAQDLPDAAL